MRDLVGGLLSTTMLAPGKTGSGQPWPIHEIFALTPRDPVGSGYLALFLSTAHPGVESD